MTETNKQINKQKNQLYSVYYHHRTRINKIRRKDKIKTNKITKIKETCCIGLIMMNSFINNINKIHTIWDT